MLLMKHALKTRCAALISTILLLLIFPACKEEPITDPATTLRDVIQADNRGDLEKVVTLYTADAMLLPAGRTDIMGRDAIREHYGQIFSTTTLQLHPRVLEEWTRHDIAMIHGTITGKTVSKTDSSEHIVDDKFLMFLKMDSGKWKIHRLMWSQDHD